MCGGDGLADVVGRRYGSAKLPFNHSKSWVGSLAMFTGKADAVPQKQTMRALVYAVCKHSACTAAF